MAKRSTVLQETEALSRFNRPRRQVEPPSGFQTGQGRPILTIGKTGKVASCTAGTKRFLSRKIIFQGKNRFHAVSAPGNPQHFSRSWWGGGRRRIRKMLRFRPRRTVTLLIENLRLGTRRGLFPRAAPRLSKNLPGRKAAQNFFGHSSGKRSVLGDIAPKTAFSRRKRWQFRKNRSPSARQSSLRKQFCRFLTAESSLQTGPLFVYRYHAREERNTASEK